MLIKTYQQALFESIYNDRSCSVCVHWKRARTRNAKTGRCRRFPPIGGNAWTETKDADVCGLFVPDAADHA